MRCLLPYGDDIMGVYICLNFYKMYILCTDRKEKEIRWRKKRKQARIELFPEL